MNTKAKNTNLLFNLLLITIFFNIWFPKAGLKISGIPFTIGNILFALTYFLWFFWNLKSRVIKKNRIGFLILLFISYCVLKFGIIGNIIKNIGYIIPLAVYPFMFYLSYNLVDSKDRLEKVLKIICCGFFFISLYALLQFFVGIEKCVIPGLTVNYTDFKELGNLWFMAKSNGTDKAMAKIVSTYQNGNLFGINMLLFYPIVFNYYKKYNKNIKLLIISFILFISVVFLSLSRACWLGIVLFILFGIVMDKDNSKKTVVFKFFAIFIGLCSIFIVFNYIPSVSNRFFDTKASDWISMSGRTEGLFTVFRTVYESNSFVAWIIGPSGISTFSGLAYEMFPLAMFVQLGIVGVLFMYLILYIVIKRMKNHIIHQSIKLSIIIWMIVGIIECGFWLPPFALNLYLLMGIGLSLNNYEEEEIK